MRTSVGAFAIWLAYAENLEIPRKLFSVNTGTGLPGRPRWQPQVPNTRVWTATAVEPHHAFVEPSVAAVEWFPQQFGLPAASPGSVDATAALVCIMAAGAAAAAASGYVSGHN